MRMTEQDRRLSFYRFDDVIKPAVRIPLVDADDMVRVIDRAIKRKETVTIVDEDDTLIFRCELGVVCWPRIGEQGIAA